MFSLLASKEYNCTDKALLFQPNSSVSLLVSFHEESYHRHSQDGRKNKWQRRQLNAGHLGRRSLNEPGISFIAVYIDYSSSRCELWVYLKPQQCFRHLVHGKNGECISSTRCFCKIVLRAWSKIEWRYLGLIASTLSITRLVESPKVC